jgi:hypothetical protein
MEYMHGLAGAAKNDQDCKKNRKAEHGVNLKAKYRTRNKGW